MMLLTCALFSVPSIPVAANYAPAYYVLFVHSIHFPYPTRHVACGHNMRDSRHKVHKTLDHCRRRDCTQGCSTVTRHRSLGRMSRSACIRTYPAITGKASTLAKSPRVKSSDLSDSEAPACFAAILQEFKIH
eukprot:3799237-Amphidinium_carterae.1